MRICVGGNVSDEEVSSKHIPNVVFTDVSKNCGSDDSIEKWADWVWVSRKSGEAGEWRLEGSAYEHSSSKGAVEVKVKDQRE